MFNGAREIEERGMCRDKTCSALRAKLADKKKRRKTKDGLKERGV